MDLRLSEGVCFNAAVTAENTKLITRTYTVNENNDNLTIHFEISRMKTKWLFIAGLKSNVEAYY